MFSKIAFDIFWESIKKYHILDDVYQPFENLYHSKSIEHLLYRKNWIDTVQWHYEDIIRDPNINPIDALDLNRTDASKEHKEKCNDKLQILLEQKKDLSEALDQLLADIEAGRKYMKVYKQMKMYNDEELNPILRNIK